MPSNVDLKYTLLPPAIYLDLSNVIYHILGHVTKQESIFLLS